LDLLNQKEAGIYFAYNNLKEKRNKENVQGINAWTMEIDDLPKQEQYEKILNCPIMPSFQVETSKSVHCYWLAEDGTLENFEKIQSGLIQYFGSDTALKDPARMLRIPGFYHNKKEPCFCTLTYDEADYHKEKDMLEAFPYKEKEQKNYTINPFWDSAGNVPVKQALLRLSGTKIVNNEVYSFRRRTGGGEYIDIDGQPADCWLDDRGLIGSGKGAGPTIIQWLKFYGNDNKTIAEWLKKNCTDLMPADFVEFDPKDMLETKQEEEDIIFKDKRVFTWGTNEMNRKITPINGLVMFSGATGSGKTAFCFYVAKENARIGNRVLFLSLEMTEDEIYTRFARDQAGITKEQWGNKNTISEEQKKVYLYKKKELREMQNLYLRGFPRGVPGTTENIFKTIEVFKADLVFIDNFDLIDKTDSSDLKYQIITSNKLKDFAQNTRVPLVVLHHQKTGAKAMARQTTVDLLRGSSKIEHNAYAHISGTRINHTEEPKEKASFIITEHKDREFGGNGIHTTYFYKGNFFDEFVENRPTAHIYN
jgi:archaellum biogenesis ATPase FlaH